MSEIDPDANPWGAATKSELRLRQLGCGLVFLFVVTKVVAIVILVGVTEYGWFR